MLTTGKKLAHGARFETDAPLLDALYRSDAQYLMNICARGMADNNPAVVDEYKNAMAKLTANYKHNVNWVHCNYRYQAAPIQSA